MAEEAEVPTKEELQEALESDNTESEGGSGEEEAPEVSEVEQKAIDMGWNPEGVEGKKNLTPEEFVDRKALYDDLHSLKRQNKQLRGDIDNINKYQEDIRADERKKVVEELKTQKREALDDGDHERVVEIDEKLNDERDKAKEEKVTPKTNEDFDVWVTNNPWYQDDKELREEADIYGEVYWTKNPTKTRDEVYKAVATHIKRSFKDKFGNSNRDKPAAVEPSKGTPRGKGKKAKHTVKDLPSEARSVMRTILRTTKMTEEAYVKQYFAMNGES